MSKLGRFFKGGGSSKGRGAPSPQEALARLRETEEMLGKKQDYLESRIQRELALAKKHGRQNKRGRPPAPAPAPPGGQARRPMHLSRCMESRLPARLLEDGMSGGTPKSQW